MIDPMVLLPWFLGILTLLSLFIGLWQWIAARRFKLHHRTANLPTAPPIALFKPVKGADPALEPCLRSWFCQSNVGPLQILFGVGSTDDPACVVIRKLISEFPSIDAHLLICDQNLGINSKVSKLTQLARHAKHDVWVVSDADVQVAPDLLSELADTLSQSGVGLAHCFYAQANPTTLAMRTEAVAVNADFWSQVIQSSHLKPVDFALGAVMGFRRQTLGAIGGFESLANHLADDYQLGNRIAKQGLSIRLCPVVVECHEPTSNWQQVWNHQLRWARTIRYCQPVPYFFSILSNGTLWPLLWSAVTRHHTVWLVSVLCLVFRIGSALDLQARLTRSNRHLFYDWLVPIKDLMSVLVWMAAFLGSHVVWKGMRYKVRADGTLNPI